MSYRRSVVTVDDSVDTAPFRVVDDLVVVVRTPRSQHSVTVEVAPVSCMCPPAVDRSTQEVAVCSSPPPCLSEGWQGELELGGGGRAFRIREHECSIALTRIEYESAFSPWAHYEFVLEHEWSDLREPVHAG